LLRPVGEVLGEETVLVVVDLALVAAHLDRLAALPRLAPVLRGPHIGAPSRPSLQAHAQEQRAVGHLDDVARTHRRRSRGELLAGDARALPGLPSVYGAMHITVRHALLVVEVLRQQVTGGKQCPVAGTRQPLLAANQVLDPFPFAPRL